VLLQKRGDIDGRKKLSKGACKLRWNYGVKKDKIERSKIFDSPGPR
jgi:hypothetical protein